MLLTVIELGRGGGVPRACAPKASERGEAEAIGAGVTAVPVTVTMVGEPAALETIRTVAFLVPAVVGANVTLIVQEPPGATVAQELTRLNWPGLAPARLAELTTRLPAPVLLTVMSWGADAVPVFWVANVSDTGRRSGDCRGRDDAGAGQGHRGRRPGRVMGDPDGRALGARGGWAERHADRAAGAWRHRGAGAGTGANWPGLAPMSATAETTRFAPPVLLTVMSWAAEVVPVLCDPKASDAGETEMTGVAVTTPGPDRVTLAGDPAASWAMLIEAALAPSVVGVNVTPMVHEAAGATGAVRNWLWWRMRPLLPPRVTPDTVRAAVPVLLTVIDCDAEVLARPWFPKASEAGETDATGAAAVPVPVRPTLAGEPAALLAIERLAVFAPTVVGAKATLTVQLALMTTVAQVVPAIKNNAASAPVRVTPDTTRLAVPVLVSVTTCVGEVVVSAWLAKASDEAESDAAGPMTVSEETRTGAARRSHVPRTAPGTSQKLSRSMFHSVSTPSADRRREVSDCHAAVRVDGDR